MQVGYVIVHLLHGLAVFFIKRLCYPTHVWYVEQRLKEFDNHTVLITQVKDHQHHPKEYAEKCKERPKEGRHLLRIDNGKEHHRRTPQADVRKNVHHGIKHDTRHGTGHANVGTEFHHTIGATTKAKRRGITEGKARHRKFVGVAKGKMTVVRPPIDYQLKGASIESINKDPHTYDSRQIKTGSTDVVT